MGDIPPLMWRCHCGRGPMTPAEFDRHRVACEHRAELERLRGAVEDASTLRTRLAAVEAERDEQRAMVAYWVEKNDLTRRATAEEIAAWLDDVSADRSPRAQVILKFAASDIRAKWCGKEGK